MKKIDEILDRIVRVLYRLSVRFWKKRRISLTQVLIKRDFVLPDSITKKRFPDIIRYSNLEICSEKINNNKLIGSVAELGVYKGEFSAYINKCFPERKLYLFDTFEGFDDNQFLIDKKNYNIVKNVPFKTSISEVIEKMPFPDKCIIKKGVFRGIANDINDQFVFVSLDADLFDPIYLGLKFFYPKLVRGGYIFIHDYNNPDWPGAKEAVDKFCVENSINCVPVADAQGSAIITK